MNKIIIKSSSEIKKMEEGGKRLREIKLRLKDEVKEGVNAGFIDMLADELIKKSGGEPSFKMVKNYFWAVCININDGVVHGIPRKDIIFRKGDLVSVDLGLYYKEFHTDTSFSVDISAGQEVSEFLKVGRLALEDAIDNAKVGNRIYDISEAIENRLEKNDLVPIRALVGHGIGRNLHEGPQIPCFKNGKRSNSEVIPKGAAFAIEVMYTKGNGDVTVDSDGWTIRTSDGKIAGLFEDTIAVTESGQVILT